MSEMEAGRELDALIAERAMGWTEIEWVKHDGGEYDVDLIPVEPEGYPHGPDEIFGKDEVPRYSTDIAAAWKVVEALRSRGWKLDLTEAHLGWQATLGRAGVGDEDFWVSRWSEPAATAPLAICRATLKADAPPTPEAP